MQALEAPLLCINHFVSYFTPHSTILLSQARKKKKKEKKCPNRGQNSVIYDLDSWKLIK